MVDTGAHYPNEFLLTKSVLLGGRTAVEVLNVITVLNVINS